MAAMILRRLSRCLSVLHQAWIEELIGSWGTARQLLNKQLAQQYRYSWLGVLWAAAPSALTALVLMTGQGWKVQQGGVAIPAPFYGVFGLSMAQTFIEAMNSCRLLFSGNQQLFCRYKVPLDGFIMASLLEVILNMVVRLLVVTSVFIVFRVQPVVATLPLAALGFIAIACLGSGIGLLCAPLNSLKTDFQNFFLFAPWIVFAITPIFTPFSQGSLFASIAAKLPLSILFESTRAAAYGGASNPWAVLPGLVVGLILMICGWIFCRIARPYVVERFL